MLVKRVSVEPARRCSSCELDCDFISRATIGSTPIDIRRGFASGLRASAMSRTSASRAFLPPACARGKSCATSAPKLSICCVCPSTAMAAPPGSPTARWTPLDERAATTVRRRRMSSTGGRRGTSPSARCCAHCSGQLAFIQKSCLAMPWRLRPREGHVAASVQQERPARNAIANLSRIWFAKSANSATDSASYSAFCKTFAIRCCTSFSSATRYPPPGVP